MKPTASAPIDVKISARGGPIRWLVVGGAFLIGAITIGTTIMAGNFRERALASAERQLENNVLVPRVMSHAVKLNPLVVLVALLIGNQLLGLAGALFAIPAAAAVAVIVDELHQERVAQLEAARGSEGRSGP